MSGFINLRLAVCITAAAGQKHPPVMEADVIDNGKLIVRYGLLKCPEKVVGRCHQQGAVPDGILLIPPQRGIRIFFRDTIKVLNERFKL